MSQAAAALLADAEAKRGNIWPAVAFLAVYGVFGIWILICFVRAWRENRELRLLGCPV